MAINPNTQYPTKTNAPDANYPYGSARNVVTSGDGTGTPWEKELINDIFGMQQAILNDAGIIPSGAADTIVASQYLEALNKTKVIPATTVADMTSKSDLTAGMIVQTAEFYSGTGGGGIYDIISGTGTVNGRNIIAHDTLSISFVLRIGSILDIKQLGAIADWNGSTGTDNAAIIQGAIDLALAVYISDGDYLFSSQITNPDVVPIYGPGRLFFDGSGEHAFIFGAPDGANHIYNSTIISEIYLERTTQDWTDDWAGVVLANVNEGLFSIHARRFKYPIKMWGYDKGCVHNTIFLKHAGDGLSQILMHADGTSGWCNQNTIVGGRIFTISSTSSTDDVTGIEFRCDSSKTLNGNQFVNTSFELFNAGTGSTQTFKGSGTNTDIAIKTFMDGGRLEATDFLLGGKGVFQCMFRPTSSQFSPSQPEQLLNADTPDDKLVLMDNDFMVTQGNDALNRSRHIATMNKTNMVTQQPDGAELGCKPARGVIYEAAAVDQLVFHDAAIGLKHGSFTNGSSDTIIGWLLDLRNVNEDYTKVVTIKASVEATGGRFAAVCLDASYAPLESSDDCSLTFNAGNDIFRDGSDITADRAEQKIIFGDNVKFAIVGVVQGSADADIRSLELMANYSLADIHICYDPQVVSGIGVKTVNSISVSPIIDTNSPLATQSPLAPTAGNSYPPALNVINADAATTEAEGWVTDGLGTTWLAKAALT